MRKRRQFTPEFKARVVLDILTGVRSQAEACRKHGLRPNLVALWKTAFLERAHLVFDSDTARSAEQAFLDFKRRSLCEAVLSLAPNPLEIVRMNVPLNSLSGPRA